MSLEFWLGEVMKKNLLGDRYKILEKLGQRQDQMMLLARDIGSLDAVVIKLQFMLDKIDPESSRLFKREGEILKSLSHPAIPRYLDYFELNQDSSRPGFALVQSFVDGRSLEDCLKAGRVFEEMEVRQIAHAVLDTLIYLHGLSHPVLHRNIKPGNILLSERGEGKPNQCHLVDFGGVAEFTNRESTSFLVVGTQGYLSPEQVGGLVSEASDLYSLGVTLITLATRTHPARLPRRNLRIHFEQLVDLSPDFAAWLKWLTEPAVPDRPHSAQAALQALVDRQLITIDSLAAHIIRRPAVTRVALVKASYSLEVRIPPLGLTKVTGILGLLTLAWNGIALTALGFSLQAVPNLTLALVLPAALMGGLGLGLLLLWLFISFRRIRLKLDQRQISLVYELFTLKYAYPGAQPIKTVSKLRYIKNPAGGNGGNEGSAPGTTKIQPRIIIHAGQKKYEIGSTFLFHWLMQWGIAKDGKAFGILSQEELDWLAYELSVWLKLPIVSE